MPKARNLGQDLMRGEGTIPNDGLGPGVRTRKPKMGAVPVTAGGGSLVDKVLNKGKQKKAIPGGGSGPKSAWRFKTEDGYKTNSEIAAGHLYGTLPNYDGAERTITGTSIFDPVLCELVYRWFSPPGGVVLDPFAGGSVRGIVAAKLGREYLGIDLRYEQVAANRAQALKICGEGEDDAMPAWHVGDSVTVLPTLECEADLLFTCPPYGDLEVYSDMDADLSNMGHAEFIAAYRTIIKAALAKLKDDRFAVMVVGDFRDKKGFYRNFIGDTIRAFLDAGAQLYNEAILVTSVGSLPIRAGRQFSGARKLGKTHQNVLVFVKGSPKKATEACGPIEVDADLLEETPDTEEAPALVEGAEPIPFAAT